jgi:coenzyme F420 hydrogenase subunit beta
MSDVLDIDEIVTGGLCIGCGLCRSIAGAGAIDMVTTPEGRERPVVLKPLPSETLATINWVCPGTRIEGARPETLPDSAEMDPIWGPAVPAFMAIAYAGDAKTRFFGAAGGVLTALGQYLLRSGEVELVLHVRTSPDAPMRSVATVSETPAAVLDAAASRYGPAAVLEDFQAVLARGRPLAVIAKPCDIGAVRNLAHVDERAAALVRYCLTLACGGASDLVKSREVLDRLSVEEEELHLFRYRGHGNPGLTRIETKGGRTFELTYQEMWGDEKGWRIQPRCKICPDAIGEAADVVSADCWPGGSPVAEDAGFNAVMVRTRAGVRLFKGAVADGAVVVDRPIGFRDMDRFQPHQVRKKRAVWARLEGMAAAAMPTPVVERLRIAELAAENDAGANYREQLGAEKRARDGRLGEPPAAREG